MKEKIYIASDHAGFKLKGIIKKFLMKNYLVEDLGPSKYKVNDDYPDYALKLCKKIRNKKGILICGTGQGMCIAANKVKGIRAALCWNKFTAKHARTHLDANVLCLSGLTKPFMAKKIIKTWLQNRFIKKKKYIRRLNKIKRIEI